MKLTTKEKDDLAVRKYKEGRKDFVELQVETDTGGALVFLTPKEAVRDKMRLIIIHAVVWALVMLATAPEGDCTRSGDCAQGHYCKSGTCVPKESR